MHYNVGRGQNRKNDANLMGQVKNYESGKEH